VNPRLAEIRARRELLLARSALQRDTLALLVQQWRAPFELADRGVRIARYAREHPGALLAAIAVLVALAPKRALRWAGSALALWRGYRSARGLIEPLVRPAARRE
jgi:hypothetical protein